MASPTERPVAIVLVLGDVGRSPRMQYHALSLAQTGSARVFLVGYVGERCVPAVEAEGSAITHVRLSADLLPRPKARALYLLYAPAKAILQLAQLLWTLLVRLPPPEVLLVQNPPAIPTLAAAFIARALRGGAVVVDWHNLGFSMLQHNLRKGHPFVRWSTVYERFFGRRLDGHLCVTHAMSRWLADEWGVSARVLHDRPPSFFRRLSVAERHALFRRLAPQFVDASGAPVWPLEGSGSSSPWDGGGTPWSSSPEVERRDRPRLLVSSTSWTADEDFGVLLDALRALDATLDATLDPTQLAGSPTSSSSSSPSPLSSGPRVVAVITGKGPLKEYYRGLMRAMQLRHVAICTMWLEPSDYPALLGAADLGVSLHTSTSGLDLPMKVLDMYGCGLPVCAMGFACLSELVRDGENGRVFHTSAELAAQLRELLAPTSAASAALAQLRDGVAAAEAGRPRWAQNWIAAAAPLLVPPPHTEAATSSPWLSAWRRLLLLLRVSRPYYYLVTLWLYLMPTGGHAQLFAHWPFWVGLAYCTLPLNLMCYLMNDLSDVKVDKHNARKGGALLGAKETATTLGQLLLPTIMVQLPFLAAFAHLCGSARTLAWFMGVFTVNWLYNFGPRLSAYYAPLDLVCPCGYLLVLPLACWLNGLPSPPARSWAHASLLVVRTQLWIQTFDIEPDRAAGRRNTAVRLGLRWSQLGLLGLLLVENALAHVCFAHSWPLRSFSLGSLALLGLQVALGGAASTDGAQGQAGKGSLSPASINGTFLVLGLGGVGLMVRVWVDAAFL